MKPTTELVVSSSGGQSLTVRDIVAIGFRRKWTFVQSFLAALVFTSALALLLPLHYNSEMKLFLEKNRQDPAVSSGVMQPPLQSQTLSEEEINSEVELLNSRDVLQRVVESSGLADRVWTIFRHGPKARTELAVRSLAKKLKIEPAKKSDVLVVTYASADPELSHKVMSDVQQFYLAKHAAVHHSSGELHFFEDQKQQLSKQLTQEEAQLVNFPARTGVVSGEVERESVLQRLTDLKVQQRKTAADIADTMKSISTLRSELSGTPARMTTAMRDIDNPQLMQQLKGTLLDLELKRSALLQKYQPDYRPVQELEQQIALTRDSIARAEKSPLRDITTDTDPTHDWIRLELAKEESKLEGLQARAAVDAESIREFEESARRMNTAAIEQHDLLREAKDLEDNYLLYSRKAEEARVNDALDTKDILNVSVAEQPTFPVLPQHSRAMYLAVGFVLAFLTGAGSVVASERLDDSFRTPNEVEWYLDVPVYGALPVASPKNGEGDQTH